MRAFMIASLVVCALFIAGCVGPGAEPFRILPMDPRAVFPTLPDLEGREVLLGDFFLGGTTSYLLLVNTHSKCAETFRLMRDLCGAWDDFEALNCCCALVVQERDGVEAEVWKVFAGPHITLFRDPEGKCLAQYAEDEIPALTLFEPSSKVAFHCEGYLAPKTLADKIRRGDFSRVQTYGG